MRDHVFRRLQTNDRGSLVVLNIEPFNCISNLTVWPTDDKVCLGSLEDICHSTHSYSETMTGEQYVLSSTSAQDRSSALAVSDGGVPLEVDTARQLNDASSVFHRGAEPYLSTCSSSDDSSDSGAPIARISAPLLGKTSYDAHAADYVAETAETKLTVDFDDSRYDTIQEDSKPQLGSLAGGESGALSRLGSLAGGESGALSRLASLAIQSVQPDTSGVGIPLRYHAAAQSTFMGDTEMGNRLLEEDRDQRTHPASLCVLGSKDGGEGPNGAGDTATGEASKGERNIRHQEQGTGANTGKKRAVSSSHATDPPSVASADSKLQLYLKPLINLREGIIWQVRGDGHSNSEGHLTIEKMVTDRANSIFSRPNKHVYRILNQGMKLAKQRDEERPSTALDYDWYRLVGRLTKKRARTLEQDIHVLPVTESQELSVSPWFTQAAPAEINTPQTIESIARDIQYVLQGSHTTNT